LKNINPTDIQLLGDKDSYYKTCHVAKAKRLVSRNPQPRYEKPA
jgi:hypothetical protein